MIFVSKLFRFLVGQIEECFCFLRIIKLKLLYPGITIDFKTRIHKNCSVSCVKNGRLIILKSDISSGTYIKADAGGVVSIDDSFIGRNCVITAKEKVVINKNCLIAEMVVIRDQDHAMSPNNLNREIQNFTISPIEIKENVWIASKATILKGVTIGRNSIIAASAVVTQVVPSFEVWGGIPAKFIKKINNNESVSLFV
jgi:acetyltransferase-like isoleucine patch superfamily enzyme